MSVKLDPDAAAVLNAFREAGRPPYETLTPVEARAMYLAARPVSQPEPPKLASVESLVIPGPAGDIPARLYKPLTLRQWDGLSPCLVFFHGGGWVIGNLDSHDVVCRTLADEGQLIVISVELRIEPGEVQHRAAGVGVTSMPSAIRQSRASLRQLSAAAFPS